MKKIVFFFLLSFNLFSQNTDSVLLRYKYEKGDRYRIISEVKNFVVINNTDTFSAKILNKISVEIQDTKIEDGKNKGLLKVDYFTSEELNKDSITSYRQNKSDWMTEWKDELGKEKILRNTPIKTVKDDFILPILNVKKGNTWKGKTSIMHKNVVNTNQDVVINDIDTFYRYEGKATFKDKEYDLITINYSFVKTYPINLRSNKFTLSIVNGQASQQLYWDNKAGRIRYYFDEYNLDIKLNDGTIYKYKINSNAETIESLKEDKKEITKEIKEELSILKDNTVNINEVESGISLNFDNIQFKTNSAELNEKEIEKVDEIGKLLQKFAKNKDVIIIGHTLNQGEGTKEEHQKLSEDRALSVVNYLIKKEYVNKNNISSQGKGSSEPLYSFSDIENRDKNKRVEVLILDN